jgi:hypothetical protein
MRAVVTYVTLPRDEPVFFGGHVTDYTCQLSVISANDTALCCGMPKKKNGKRMAKE